MKVKQGSYIWGVSAGIILLFVLAVRWSSWLAGDAKVRSKTPTVESIERIGTNAGRGNLLGIQPWMEPGDYQNSGTFRDKLKVYLQTAKDSGLIVAQKTVVILPEYLGTWLVAINEPNRVYTAKTVEDALTAMVLASPIRFAKAYHDAPDSVGNKTKYAVFAMKGQAMADEYVLTFDQLAAQFEVTIVAGSILLPNPRIEGQHIVTGRGPLYNVSAVFHPDGRLDSQLVRKVFPIADELPFVCPSKPAEVPVFDTPVGRLGVLICADSWHSPVYQTLRQKGATLLAVPSFSAGDGVWQTQWWGYSGTPTPADARADVGKLTEGQAWLAHAMMGHATPEAGINTGLNVFLRGKLWDLGADGTTIVLDRKTGSKPVRPRQRTGVDGAALTCLWL